MDLKELIHTRIEKGSQGRFEEILSNTLKLSLELLQADKGMILQLNRRENHMIVLVSIGFEGRFTKGSTLDIRKLLELKRVLFGGKTTIVKTEFGPFVFAPLDSPPRITRVIALRRNSSFSGFDLKIISTIISLSEIIFTKYKDQGEGDEFMKGGFKSLYLLLEEKNPVLLRHSNRVMKLSKIIARSVALPYEKIQKIKIAALLHELDSFTETESTNKKDPHKVGEREEGDKAERIIDLLKIPEEVQLILRHRGEWVNGGGVPDGLKEEEIPIGSRILSIADSLDEGLMKGREEDDVLTEMSKNARTRFDPYLLEKLFEIRGWEGMQMKNTRVKAVDPFIEKSKTKSSFL